MTTRLSSRRGGAGNTSGSRNRERELEEHEQGFLGPLVGKSQASGPAARTRTPPPPPPKGDLLLKTNHLTPNGLKVLIYLQELLLDDPDLFDLDIETVIPSLGKSQRPGLDPSGRIPILVDKLKDEFQIFDSAAILLYLEQNYDRGKLLTYDPSVHPKEYSSMIQWLMWTHATLGPTQTQAHYFWRYYYSEDAPSAKQKFKDDTIRLYSIMDDALLGRDYLVDGPKGCTLADINAYPWIRLHDRADIKSLEQWPRLQDWLNRMSERPAVRKAVNQTNMGEDRSAAR